MPDNENTDRHKGHALGKKLKDALRRRNEGQASQDTPASSSRTRLKDVAEKVSDDLATDV